MHDAIALLPNQEWRAFGLPCRVDDTRTVSSTLCLRYTYDICPDAHTESRQLSKFYAHHQGCYIRSQRDVSKERKKDRGQRGLGDVPIVNNYTSRLIHILAQYALEREPSTLVRSTLVRSPR